MRLRGAIVVACLAGFAAAALISAPAGAAPPATTPIQHVVVLFGEGVSFDHYFGTYPAAANPAGEPAFTAKAGTPAVDGLTPALLTSNPNSANPERMDRSQSVTCAQSSGYNAEQKAFNGGLMDKFPENTGGASCTDKSIVMDYYDGNTVTGLWNLAQGFALSDSFYGTGFGPSTPGALELVSGQTHGATTFPGAVENGTLIGNADPAGDDCGSGSGVSMSGQNVGDLMNAKGVTWGWFQGGFRPTSESGGKAICGASHQNAAGATVTDYSARHEPFQYYASTANPHHLPPTSAAMIGESDQAKHQYDLADFDTAIQSGNLPQVSFLKAPQSEDGHAGASGPLDEQRFIAAEVNQVEASPFWASTAIVIAYADSGGWYDHAFGGIVRPSNAASDDPVLCGASPPAPGAYLDRCGYGPRLPLLVISPWARPNYVDHTKTDQSSITRFIEDNWGLGRIGDQSADADAGPLTGMFDFTPPTPTPPVSIDPTTGQVLPPGPTPTPTSTPTPTPTSTPMPTPTPKAKELKVAVKCATEHAGRRLTVTCTVIGDAVKHGATALRFRLLKGKKLLATASTHLHGGKATVTLRARKKLEKGRYKLKIAIARKDGSASVTRKVRIR